ncbi:MAG: archease [Acidobacteriota bacterium]|nr:archease [Acidobacteriota bacterium]
MIRGPSIYELIDHTADTGIVVRGRDLPELFESAAAAMFDVMVDLARVSPRLPPERVALAGVADPELLLVAWLGELLSRAMARNRLYCEFEILELTGAPDGWRLAARVAGAPFEEYQEVFKTELKAVTYHDLRVRKEEGAYVARVVFDQ